MFSLSLRNKRLVRALSLVAVCLLTGIFAFVAVSWAAGGASGQSYTLTFTYTSPISSVPSPADSTEATETSETTEATNVIEAQALTLEAITIPLFADRTVSVTGNAYSGNFIVPQDSYTSLTFDSAFTGDQQLDRETFYFQTFSQEALENGELWAYTFTGWHIVGTEQYLPEKTVFQPGDVITAQVMEEYAVNGELKLEALWGKCYFIRNQYNQMVYTTAVYPAIDSYSSDTVTVGVLDTNACKAIENNATGAFDIMRVDGNLVYNAGNNRNVPAATLDYVYTLFAKNGEQQTNAYHTVIMLTGTVEDVKDVDSLANRLKNPGTKADDCYIDPVNGYVIRQHTRYFGESTRSCAVTLKSLQAVCNNGVWSMEDGKLHAFYFKPLDDECDVAGSLRIDNVRMLFKKDVLYNQAGTLSTVPIATTHNELGRILRMYDGNYDSRSLTPQDVYENDIVNGHILEITQRAGNEGDFPFKTIRMGECEHLAMNGGNVSWVTMAWSNISNNQEYTEAREQFWYFGRYAVVSRLILGSESSSDEFEEGDTTDYSFLGNNTVVITGGRINTIHGGSVSLADRVYAEGNRTYYILGDGTDNGTSRQYDPEIVDFYGGGQGAEVRGNVDINVVGCTRLTNLYGGGEQFAASVLGNIDISIEDSVLAGDLYGGGKYGNCEDDPSSQALEGQVNISVSNSKIGGTVFGSGQGQVNTMEAVTTLDGTVANGVAIPPESWNEIPEGFPQMDVEGGTYYLFADAYKSLGRITGRGTGAESVAWKYVNVYYYLSMATVQDVTIDLDNTDVGGSVYGGGVVAWVYGNTDVNITGSSTVSGNVYGGSDGTGTIDTVKLYEPIEEEDNYTPPVPVQDENGNYPDLSVQQSPRYNEDKYLGEFSWSCDESLLDLETPGIDLVNHKIYTPYDAFGIVGGNTAVNVGTGASVNGDVYGGGNAGSVKGNTTISVDGTVKSTIYGGAASADIGTVSVDEEGNVTKSGGNITVNINSGAVVNTVYGGNDASGTIAGQINVNITGCTAGTVYGGGNNANIEADTVEKIAVAVSGSNVTSVYGGGNNALCCLTPTVTISSGKIGTVFGGGNNAATDGSDVTIRGGTIETVYGGGNAGTVPNTSVTISGGTMGTVFGGGLSEVATVDTSHVTVTSTSTAKITKALYGGGNAGPVETTYVDVLSSTGSSDSIANIYGGGLSSTAVVDEANVTIGAGVKVNGAVYGGGNEAYTDTTAVTVNGGNLAYLYGGGNKADVNTTEVTVKGGINGTVYGGGNAGDAVTTQVTINTSATYVVGGGQNSTTGGVYGGGNQGSVGTANVTMLKGSTGTIYGGGNQGETTETNVSITSGTVPTVYGGGNAGESGTTNVTINGGTIETVYGGGLSEAAAVDTANVTVTSTSTAKITNALYGGGNAGPARKTNVNAMSSTGTTDSIANIYGGGLSSTAVVDEAHVTVGAGVTVSGDVYGGGDQAYTGTTEVTATGGNLQYVYGGGNNADVGQTTVQVGKGTVSGKTSGGIISQAVYGGGNNGKAETTNVIINHTANATNAAYIVGRYGGVYGGGNNGDVGTANVTLISGRVPVLYGGGNAADTEDTNVTVEGGTVNGNLYGGGYAGNVSGDANVLITAGSLKADLYGGGYAGTVGNASVILQDAPGKTITAEGDIFGGGEGVTATVKGDTCVTVDLDYDFIAVETPVTTTNISPSGAVTTQITPASGVWSSIGGNIYGGGDLAQVGEGVIYSGGESARITSAGSTNVTIKNGCIEGSVFGGGCGVPNAGTAYQVSMGTVFGATSVTVEGGWVKGSVLGGGEQSRVYADGTQATNVNITETAGKKIAITGSVFGGGDRGESGATNASVPTVIGDASVNITGYAKDVPSQIYFLKGGVYGDGNLCLVDGKRTITLTNFEAEPGYLKTFYSLQRADQVTLCNSAVVLLGALDLVEEGDTSIYSINRVDQLDMTQGSTIKLDNVVKYLGGLRSDLHTDRKFIHNGNNGANNYNTGYTVDALTDSEVENYQNNVSHTSADKNVVCVANGLYLEVRDDDGVYGAVDGLFTLQLLYANPGEGGGFVYGSIPDSNGDFICETVQYKFEIAHGLTEDAFYNSGKTYYLRVAGKGFQLAGDTYDPGAIYYTGTPTGEFMGIIDNVGGVRAGYDDYKYYYWYIGGPAVLYNVDIVGYIGAANTEFAESSTIAQHDVLRSYVLYGVRVNDTLKNALDSNIYTLVTDAASLTGDEIAIELRLGNTSLGFIKRVADDTWGVYTPQGSTILGYSGTIAQAVNNVLCKTAANGNNDTVTWILHKATTVSTEISDMQVYLDIDRFEANDASDFENVSTEDAMLSFTANISLVRLMPTQVIFHDNLRSYSGVGTSDAIHITGNSCFTAEFQTSYIPATFSDTVGSMEWKLSTVGRTYYMDDATGAYLTVQNGSIVAHTNGMTNIQASGNGYTATLNGNTITLSYAGVFSASSIPANTKITMVDLSGDAPKYYYFICHTATNTLDLSQFMQMGTTTTIAQSSKMMPDFMTIYDKQEMTQIKERILFVFDFEQVVDDNLEFAGGMILEHLYNGQDIMDYTKSDGDSTYLRSTPKELNYRYHKDRTGVDKTYYATAFADSTYHDIDTAMLKVTVEEDPNWINTLFRENGFALRIQLQDTDGNPVAMPEGMYFEYMGQKYYPNAESSVIGVTVYDFGTHEILIHNPQQSLAAAVGSNTATFVTSFYSAPDAAYYNAFDTEVKKTASYTILDNLTDALKVDPGTGSNRVLHVGSTLCFDLQTDVDYNRKDGQIVSVKLYRKDGGNYIAVDLTSVFGHLDSTVTSGAQSWLLTGGISGTYRIVFNYASHTEYLNFIID